MDLSGIAILGAGGLLKQRETTFAELYNDPAQSTSIVTAAKSGSKKDAVAKYVKPVDVTATLVAYLPDGASDAVRLSKELLAKAAAIVDKVGPRLAVGRQVSFKIGTQVTDQDFMKDDVGSGKN